MAKPHGPNPGHPDGDGGTSPRRNGTPSGGARSIAEAQETTALEASGGRAGGDGGRPDSGSGPGRSDDLITHPTGERGGTPEGQPTRIGPDEDDDVRRSLERENSGAVILADQGHQIRQNPTADEVAQARQASGDTGRPGSKPDYLLEGRVFDCYSPSRHKSARGIGSEVEKKIKAEQTQRVVVNLEDWGGTLPDLRRQFADWPVDGLKELKAITPEGAIVQIIPRAGE